MTDAISVLVEDLRPGDRFRWDGNVELVTGPVRVGPGGQGTVVPTAGHPLGIWVGRSCAVDRLLTEAEQIEKDRQQIEDEHYAFIGQLREQVETHLAAAFKSAHLAMLKIGELQSDAVFDVEWAEGVDGEVARRVLGQAMDLLAGAKAIARQIASAS